MQSTMKKQREYSWTGSENQAIAHLTIHSFSAKLTQRIPQRDALMTSPRATYLIILGGALLWCIALVVAPFLATFPGAPGMLGAFLYAFFHPICHQLDARSFHIFSGPMAVCSRCASIYFAFLGGTILYPLFCDVRKPVLPHRAFLYVAVLPMLADIAAGMLGIHEVSNITRLFTGAAFGLIAPFFIVPATVEALQQASANSPMVSDIHAEKGQPHA